MHIMLLRLAFFKPSQVILFEGHARLSAHLAGHDAAFEDARVAVGGAILLHPGAAARAARRARRAAGATAAGAAGRAAGAGTARTSGPRTARRVVQGLKSQPTCR